MIRFVVHYLLCILLLSQEADCRSWKDVKLIHKVSPRNINTLDDQRERTESDVYYEEEPTPVDSPPVDITVTNVVDQYHSNDVPQVIPPGYFNYDTSENSKYGPGHPKYYQYGSEFRVRYANNAWQNNWKRPGPGNYYWDEFGAQGWGAWRSVLANHNLEDSVCGTGTQQSPIDIRLSGVACVETHQIRSRPGDFRLEGQQVKKHILPNKLRLKYDRRPCRDLSNEACKEPDPPFADFPNGWASDADTLHIDFKLPAEHQIYGNKFDAEMQVFHIHPGRRLLPAISVLFKVGDYNPIMDQVIDAFQYKFDVDAAKCGENRRRGRQLVSDFYSTVMEGKEGNVGTESYYKGWGEFSTKMDDPNFAREEQEQERKLAEKWHPYHPDIMKSIYFYGYDGSLTEPPCTEIVSWFVMDTPATISQGQLDRLKNILFNHVDKDCQRTSTHYQKRGVARPPQDRNGRMVWHCNANHFTPDN